MNVLIVGDIHNEFPRLNILLTRLKPDLVLACGDYGFWPRLKEAYPLSRIKTNCKILFCDGNHEDFESLNKRTSDELYPNVIYMPRGSTYTLPDGRTIMFFGGAFSIDREWRTLGHTYFNEETICQKDFMNLPEKKIDIFITHTCPKELLPEMLKYNSLKVNDPSNEALSQLYEIYKPKLWYFGHWHKHLKGKLGHTNWECLSDIGSIERWWTWLPHF